MPFLFTTKYEKKYQLESAREKRIQRIQAEQGCSREYAVRYYDYQKQVGSHNALKLTSGFLYMYGAHKISEMLAKDIPLLQKSWARAPIVTGGFLLGCALYEKLVYHYFNWQDRDVPHTWEMDLKAKYGLKHDEGLEDWERNLALTPFERLQKEQEEHLNNINVEGDKTFRRLSKDKNDFYYLFGKIRNLENVSLVGDDLNGQSKINPVELQMIVDTVKPTLISTNDPNNIAEEIHSAAAGHKAEVENSRNFRSVKDKLLGLPFMMLRHQQFPIPYKGTWQWGVYEQMFGEPYDFGTYNPETEEKINKFNYHLFLHPSVIKKFDTNSEEFDMYLRQLNFESKTKSEQRAKQREYFCKKIMPVLNMIDNKEAGYDYANYVMNKERSNNYGNYLFEQFSGQKEEALFREAEETKYIDKNEPFVQRVAYANVATERIGIKPSELDEILNNPSKFKKMRKVLENSYYHYEPAKKIDYIKARARFSTFVEIMLERDLDPNSPDFNIGDLKDMMWDMGEEENEEAEAINAVHVNHTRSRKDINSYPYGRYLKSPIHYIQNLNWNDYAPDQPSDLVISPKTRRFEMYNNLTRAVLDSFFTRSFNNPAFLERADYIIPSIDYQNEELKSKVLFRSNYHRFLDNNFKIRDSDKEKLEFLENKSMDDSYTVSDDVTEEQLDQALFEATYAKPYWEMDELKDLKRRNHKEIEQLFKVLDFDAHEQWFEHPVTNRLDLQRRFTDKAQLIDPLARIITEVEQPTKLREYLKRWRSGAEMRFKLPYYPDTQAPPKYFNYI